MKAILQPRYGPADVLEFGEIERPTPNDDEVLIEVLAASIGAWDWHALRPTPHLMRIAGYGLRRPRRRVLGNDLAGRIVTVGSNVNGFAVGDEVYGEGHGAFAEFACASPGAIAAKPANLTFEQAAAVPTAAVTALIGLRDLGGLQPGQRVAIIGAAGGVGTFAVQVARALGGDVTAVCSADAADLVRSLGADHVVDYTTESLVDTPEPFDLILQLSGSDSASTLRQALTRDGTLVMSSGEGGPIVGPLPRLARGLILSRFVSQRVRTFVTQPSTEMLSDMTEMIEAGDVVPIIEATHLLSETAAAIDQLQHGHARGKTVIVI